MITDISSRDLLVFITLARMSSYTLAASSLGMTQSTMSKKIKDLEEKLQVRLFDRTTRQVALTPEGHEFLRHATNLLEQMERSLSDVRERAAGRRGRLSIASGPHMSGNMLPLAISEFAKQHPDVEITLHDCQSQETLTYILSEQAEIGLTVRPVHAQDHPQLDFQRLLERKGSLMAVMHNKHPLATRHEVAWTDLQPFRILLLRHASAASRLVETALTSHSVNFGNVFEVSLIDTALGMAASDHGIAILPSYVKSRHREDSLVYRPIEQTSVRFNFGLHYLRGRSLSGTARSFANHLRDYFQEW